MTATFSHTNDQRRHSRGFTLIELLVVIAIIGLLSSIILASLNTARAKGRDAALFEDTRQLMTALQLYYNQYGVFPPSNPNNPPPVKYANIEGSATDPTLKNDLAPYMSLLPNPGTFKNSDKIGYTTSRLMYRVLTNTGGGSVPANCSAAAANCYALLIWPEAASSLAPANTAIYFLSDGEVRTGFDPTLY